MLIPDTLKYFLLSYKKILLNPPESFFEFQKEEQQQKKDTETLCSLRSKTMKTCDLKVATPT